jgi:hypothetical protein
VKVDMVFQLTPKFHPYEHPKGQKWQFSASFVDFNGFGSFCARISVTVLLLEALQ